MGHWHNRILTTHLAEIIAFSLFISILIFLVFDHHPPAPDKLPEVLSLKKNWEYTIQTSSTDNNLPLWEALDDFLSINQPSPGQIWFRKKIYFNENWQKPVLFVSGYYGNLSIYLNDEFIANDKNSQSITNFAKELVHSYTLFHLPKKVKANHLVVHYVHPQGVYAPPIEILLGNLSAILLYKMKSNLYKMIVISFAILAGIFTLTVFLFHGQFNYNLEFGLGTFLLFIGLFMLSGTSINMLFYSNAPFWVAIGNTSYFIFPFGMIHIFLNVFGSGRWNLILILKKIHKVYFFAGIPVILIILFMPLNQNNMLTPLAADFVRLFIVSYNALIVIGLVIMTIISSFKAYKKEQNGLIFTIGVLPTALTAYHDIYLARYSENLNTISHWGVLIYLFAMILVVSNFQREKEKKIEFYSQELFKLETMLGEAKIKSLQDRMDPHFLFNSLNTIYALSKSDTEQTGRAILSLAENYRFLLEKTGNALIDFEDEWLFAVNYLRLFQYRYADILETEIVKEGSFADVKIPPFTIQPLLENIFKHGFKTIQEKWKIRLLASSKNGQIKIHLTDNGNGFANNQELMNRSIGNIKSRLLHYFPHLHFELHNLHPHGASISIHYSQAKKRDNIEI